MFFFIRVETVFFVFIEFENPFKVLKITIWSHIVQVSQQQRVSAPELGLKFREVYVAGLVLLIIGVSGADPYWPGSDLRAAYTF